MLPMLREAHLHLPMHGRALSTLALDRCASVEECLELVRGEAARLDALGAGERGRWLIGGGVRTESWRVPRWPTREELDAIVGSRCAMVMSFDYHALLASTSAMRAAKIGDTDSDPDGGVIVRDARSGRPTGLLLEGAARLVRDAVPEGTWEERKELVRAAIRDLARHGFVEVHDLLSPAWLGPVLAELHDAGELELYIEPGAGSARAMRVGLYPLVKDLPAVAAGAQAWERPGRVELLGGKVFVDGTLNARTAWMLEAYREPLAGHPCGTPLMGVAEIAEAIGVCRGLGLGFAAHAIGDGAVRAVLDGVQRSGIEARRHRGMEDPTSALRIEHAEIVDERDVGRFAALGVVASVQPCHLLYDIEVLTRQVPHRLHRVLPIREWIASGLVPGQSLVFGSDTPIVRPDPMDTIIAAVHRRRCLGAPGGAETREAIAAKQAIDERTAWECFGWGEERPS